jgi:hypothetical protein
MKTQQIVKIMTVIAIMLAISFSASAQRRDIQLKEINIGQQSGILTAGNTAGTVRFEIETKNIDLNAEGTIFWYSDAEATRRLLSKFDLDTDLSTGSEKRILTVTISPANGENTQAGTFFFRVSIDGVVSSSIGKLTVNAARNLPDATTKLPELTTKTPGHQLFVKTVTINPNPAASSPATALTFFLTPNNPNLREVTVTITARNTANDERGAIWWFTDPAGTNPTEPPPGVTTRMPQIVSVDGNKIIYSIKFRTEQARPRLSKAYYFRVYSDDIGSDNVGILYIQKE